MSERDPLLFPRVPPVPEESNPSDSSKDSQYQGSTTPSSAASPRKSLKDFDTPVFRITSDEQESEYEGKTFILIRDKERKRYDNA